jgi:hypothetical protein
MMLWCHGQAALGHVGETRRGARSRHRRFEIGAICKHDGAECQ